VSGGLFGLLDDIAALAKLAASSLDDVSVAAGRASMKAAGVVVDDTAVTPAYVHGLTPDRELPIIKRIAAGSLRNKLLIILPVALLLSAVAPVAVEIVLLLGGCYLAYEGAHKIQHRLAHRSDAEQLPAVVVGPEAESAVVRGAVRTDFILSAEIMVIALKEVIDAAFVSRAITLVVVAVLITAVVYGVVALIVKMDDVGLSLSRSPRRRLQLVGRALVVAVPRLLSLLAVVGTAAMCWVGGHILLVGAHELGWHWPYDQVHHLEVAVGGVGGVGAPLAWLVGTAVSALLGIAVGFVVVMGVTAAKSARMSRRPVSAWGAE
jgi:uncharacterized protein